MPLELTPDQSCTWHELDLEACVRRLDDSGRVILRVEDEGRRALPKIVNALGVAVDHNSAGSHLWDIRPQEDEAACARSHTKEPFALHTDSSFEDPPPRYIALYVIRADRFGGGRSLLSDVRELLAQVSAEVCQTLRESLFRFRVPPEFTKKGASHVNVPIVMGDRMMRYRREIIDEDYCSPRQRRVLDTLDEVLAQDGLVEQIMLPDDTLCIIDNWTTLHGRTAVRDEARHLQRIRFNPKAV